MSQQHSDSSLEEKLLEYRFHSELHLDTEGNPASGLPMVRGSLQSRSNAAFQPDAPVPPSPSPEAQELRTIVLSTQSPAALKMGTQQLIPRSLAVSSKAKTPARHQSFGAAMLSKEAARRDPRLLPAPSFSLDDMDVDTGPGGMLRRNLRNQSYRAAMKGLGTPGGEGGPVQLSPKIPALAEEPSQPSARSTAKNKKTLGRKRAHKGSFKDDPRFYQEIRERGLNTIHESDDDLLDESSSPEETQKADDRIVVKSYRPPQVTWSQLPEVAESGILDKLPAEEHERQEAIFEILTSEFSYQHSLGILVAEFLQSRELRATMTQTEHHHLFSNITDVLSASQRFFEDLEKRHRAQVCVEDVSDILEEHAERHFHPYVSYCSNEVYQQRALQQLTSSSAAFREALREIEQRPACGGLPMISFLILPMQRVTRLPLLTDTLCLKTQGHPERYKAASRALKAISKLVKQCNEGAHRMERMEQMYTLHTQLDFSKVKSLPLISASRWLLKRGELFVVEETGLFRKLSSRPTCYLFLFNDVLVVTKKKSEDSFVVQDYAQLDHIQVQKMEPSEASLPGGGNRSSFVPHAFQLTLLHNSEGRQEKILLSSDSVSDRARWITALTRWERQQPDPTNKGDLLQVEITKAYLAKQADEITLQQADVVLVLEQEDGWFYGERLRDGETGWFPEDLARSITSRVAVEGNMRRMERLRVETDV
ncbi:rho guanine nucleotide exchange factor 16 isoform X1 [Monodon monoceros]|uniref:Rho guanine nucleotide exchange factor 16 n=1 Tax=Monodon monoceros TaxID=40151 RepID=A0A8C6BTW6_MONMO|nr:rho guanine nucleotide exchange factor 16 isoform X1 [Monodon monoceros]XP_029086667.1 rho guanine nucleotide exchange factor 16 isoform X1 [Monodon monoceros]XP_029086668.1 rho guanine nucleotide exchange factor 16 isoform X1 [Monodon monoceros]XP_029086669.1 rho guanine nucleotide exchange factor 16 isoform X1 [Monodon monoceros]